jgi:hypothetical protein
MKWKLLLERLFNKFSSWKESKRLRVLLLLLIFYLTVVALQTKWELDELEEDIVGLKRSIERAKEMPEPSLEYEIRRRKIKKTIRNLSQYFKNKVREISAKRPSDKGWLNNLLDFAYDVAL